MVLKDEGSAQVKWHQEQGFSLVGRKSDFVEQGQ